MYEPSRDDGWRCAAVVARWPSPHLRVSHPNVGMTITQADRLLRATAALRANLVTMLARVDELSDLVEQVGSRAASPAPVTLAVGKGPLQLDRTTFTVRWDGRSCALGHSTAFRLLERLARRPNEYVSTDRLLDELWLGPRSYSTLRSTVCRLKSRLRGAGMSDLAVRIDGGAHGHYALLIDMS
jgi:DNA-binding response OmpR family regulator